MELVLTGAQTEVLLVHLHIMRKSIKNVLKRNYGAFEGKRLLKVYDSTKDLLNDKIRLLTANEECSYDLEEEQLEIVHSFLLMFFQKVEGEIKDKVTKSKEQEKVREHMQLTLLEEVQAKINILYAATKEGASVVR